MNATPDLLRALPARAEPPRDAWRLLAEQWPGGVLFFEPHGTVSFRNAAAGRLLPVPAPLLFAHDAVASAAWQAAQQGQGTPAPIAVLLPGHDGATHAARLTLLPLAGDAERRIACLLDWNAEVSAASPAQERQEAALEIARGGVWEMRIATGEVVYSDSYYRLLGVAIADGRATPRFLAHARAPGGSRGGASRVRRLRDRPQPDLRAGIPDAARRRPLAVAARSQSHGGARRARPAAARDRVRGGHHQAPHGGAGAAPRARSDSASPPARSTA